MEQPLPTNKNPNTNNIHPGLITRALDKTHSLMDAVMCGLLAESPMLGRVVFARPWFVRYVSRPP